MHNEHTKHTQTHTKTDTEDTNKGTDTYKYCKTVEWEMVKLIELERQ